jgi:hypothetical protein
MATAASAALLTAAATAFSQQADSTMLRTLLPVRAADVHALSRDQDNLLLLDLLGAVRVRHATIRPFGAADLKAFGNAAGGVELTRAHVALRFNSSQAYSEGDGVIWAGRGLTASFAAGVRMTWNAVSLVSRPTGFWSQNASFNEPLTETTGFRNPVSPFDIDVPWRFGGQSYARLDPGESSLRIDWRFVNAGFVTATQEWGPAHVYPLLLGANAGGFPHVFFGNNAPISIGIGTVAVRMSVGRLDPSAYALPREGDRRRLGTGLVASFVPGFVQGLELGAGRFFHRRWPSDGVDLSVVGIPFEGFVRDRQSNEGGPPDNQLANLFFRLRGAASAVEVYGEFLRDDRNQDLVDLIGEPDHESAYMLGLRKAWVSRAARRVRVVTLEMSNGRMTKLLHTRAQGPMYVHGALTEGHTNRGQLLGSPAVFGGGGFATRFESITSSARWRLEARAERDGQNEEGGTWNGRALGHHLFHASRAWTRSRLEVELGGGVMLPWEGRPQPNVMLRSAVAWRP